MSQEKYDWNVSAKKTGMTLLKDKNCTRTKAQKLNAPH